jgi:hypothetical protein
MALSHAWFLKAKGETVTACSGRLARKEDATLARFARLALVALTLELSIGASQADEPFIPSWIKNDPARAT